MFFRFKLGLPCIVTSRLSASQTAPGQNNGNLEETNTISTDHNVLNMLPMYLTNKTILFTILLFKLVFKSHSELPSPWILRKTIPILLITRLLMSIFEYCYRIELKERVWQKASHTIVTRDCLSEQPYRVSAVTICVLCNVVRI